MKATFIKQLTGFRGDARLYKLEDGRHVVVSGIQSAFDTIQPETFIFPADENGTILDWGELPGSFRGAVDHARALDRAGFTIVNP